MITLVTPTVLMAQPPEEEVAPTAPEFNIEIMDVPSTEPTTAPLLAPALQPAPTTVHQQVQPALPAQQSIPTTISGAQPAPETKEVEDKSMKGVTLNPAVTIKPLGYNGERQQGFFELSPSIGLDTSFKTAQKRDMSLGASYTFIWDEFTTNREAAMRYFEHDLSGSTSTDWNDIFSTTLNGGFNYSLWASDNREHAVFSDDSFAGKFKINNQVNVSLAYHIFFFNDLDSQFTLSDGTLPSDGDDIRQSSAAFSGADSDSFDPSSPNFNYDPTVGNSWATNNGLNLAAQYTPITGTTISAYYEYVFLTFTNLDTADWHGHWIQASIKQDLPWKGGSVMLKNQLRLRNYQANYNEDGSLLSNMRNRLTFTFDQAINETIAAQFYYRWAVSGANTDNYADVDNEHQINVGFTFSF